MRILIAETYQTLFSFVMTFFASTFLISLLSPMQAEPQMSQVLLKLPFVGKSQIKARYRITILNPGNTCFDWSVDGDLGAVDFQPISSNGCSQAALVWAGDARPGKATVSASAKGVFLYSDVYTAPIDHIEITTRERRIGLDTLETLQVDGRDKDGNKFSTLVGLTFRWSVSDSRILSFVPLSSVAGSLPPQLEIEKEGGQADRVVVKGRRSGIAEVQVQFLDGDFNLASHPVHYHVAEAYRLAHQGPLRLLPCSSFGLGLMRKADHSEIVLERGTFIFESSNPDMVMVDESGVVTTSSSESFYGQSARVLISDSRVSDNTNEALVVVDVPERIQVDLESSVLSSNTDATARIRVLSKDGKELRLTDSSQIRAEVSHPEFLKVKEVEPGYFSISPLGSVSSLTSVESVSMKFSLLGSSCGICEYQPSVDTQLNLHQTIGITLVPQVKAMYPVSALHRGSKFRPKVSGGGCASGSPSHGRGARCVIASVVADQSDSGILGNSFVANHVGRARVLLKSSEVQSNSDATDVFVTDEAPSVLSVDTPRIEVTSKEEISFELRAFDNEKRPFSSCYDNFSLEMPGSKLFKFQVEETDNQSCARIVLYPSDFQGDVDLTAKICSPSSPDKCASAKVQLSIRPPLSLRFEGITDEDSSVALTAFGASASLIIAGGVSDPSKLPSVEVEHASEEDLIELRSFPDSPRKFAAKCGYSSGQAVIALGGVGAPKVAVRCVGVETIGIRVGDGATATFDEEDLFIVSGSPTDLYLEGRDISNQKVDFVDLSEVRWLGPVVPKVSPESARFNWTSLAAEGVLEGTQVGLLYGEIDRAYNVRFVSELRTSEAGEKVLVPTLRNNVRVAVHVEGGTPGLQPVDASFREGEDEEAVVISTVKRVDEHLVRRFVADAGALNSGPVVFSDAALVGGTKEVSFEIVKVHVKEVVLGVEEAQIVAGVPHLIVGQSYALSVEFLAEPEKGTQEQEKLRLGSHWLPPLEPSISGTDSAKIKCVVEEKKCFLEVAIKKSGPSELRLTLGSLGISAKLKVEGVKRISAVPSSLLVLPGSQDYFLDIQGDNLETVSVTSSNNLVAYPKEGVLKFDEQEGEAQVEAAVLGGVSSTQVAVSVALPERAMIFPRVVEVFKGEKVDLLGTLWRQGELFSMESVWSSSKCQFLWNRQVGRPEFEVDSSKTLRTGELKIDLAVSCGTHTFRDQAVVIVKDKVSGLPCPPSVLGSSSSSTLSIKNPGCAGKTTVFQKESFKTLDFHLSGEEPMFVGDSQNVSLEAFGNFKNRFELLDEKLEGVETPDFEAFSTRADFVSARVFGNRLLLKARKEGCSRVFVSAKDASGNFLGGRSRSVCARFPLLPSMDSGRVLIQRTGTIQLRHIDDLNVLLKPKNNLPINFDRIASVCEKEECNIREGGVRVSCRTEACVEDLWRLQQDPRFEDIEFDFPRSAGSPEFEVKAASMTLFPSKQGLTAGAVPGRGLISLGSEEDSSSVPLIRVEPPRKIEFEGSNVILSNGRPFSAEIGIRVFGESGVEFRDSPFVAQNVDLDCRVSPLVAVDFDIVRKNVETGPQIFLKIVGSSSASSHQGEGVSSVRVSCRIGSSVSESVEIPFKQSPSFLDAEGAHVDEMHLVSGEKQNLKVSFPVNPEGRCRLSAQMPSLLSSDFLQLLRTDPKSNDFEIEWTGGWRGLQVEGELRGAIIATCMDPDQSIALEQSIPVSFASPSSQPLLLTDSEGFRVLSLGERLGGIVDSFCRFVTSLLVLGISFIALRGRFKSLEDIGDLFGKSEENGRPRTPRSAFVRVPPSRRSGANSQVPRLNLNQSQGEDPKVSHAREPSRSRRFLTEVKPKEGYRLNLPQNAEESIQHWKAPSPRFSGFGTNPHPRTPRLLRERELPKVNVEGPEKREETRKTSVYSALSNTQVEGNARGGYQGGAYQGGGESWGGIRKMRKSVLRD